MVQLPITPSFEAPDEFARAGFDMMPWTAPDYNNCYQQFGFSPNTLFEETSLDPFACQPPPAPVGGGGLVPQNYLTPNSPPLEWPVPGTASATGHAAQSPHVPDTPSPRHTEFSYADSDAESRHGLSPRSAEKRSVANPTQPSKRRYSQASIQTLPEAGSKATRNTRSSNKPTTTTARGKPSTSSTASFSSSSSSSMRGAQSSKNQLRTASRKPKSGNSPSEANPEDDDLTTEERRARQSHNLVEKQYRNRLNQQFESLLAVLPAERRRHSLGGDGKSRGDKTKGGIGVDDDERRLSKAEVLDMARQRIEALEQECLILQNERLELMNNMSQVRHAVGKQGAGAVA